MTGHEEKIEVYLTGKLGTDEEAAFKKKLAGDKVLQSETTLQKAAYLAIEKHGDTEIRERIHHWENPADPGLLKKYWWRLAIPLALLAGVVFFYNDFTKAPSEDKLFAEYFEKVPLRNTATYPEEQFPNWDKAAKAYRSGDFELATSYFEEHLRRQPETQEALFFTGMAFLSQNPPNLKKAEYYLGQISERPGRYSGQAKWNLTLAYLKEGRITRTKKLLRELSASRNYQNEDVQELLSQLSFAEEG